MKTLLVDDHALFRAGLRMLLRTIRPDAEILEAATVDDALATAIAHPDLQLCLLDLSLRHEHGLDALVRLRQAAPDVAVVIVSGAEDVATMHACIDAGAMSFIPKSVTPDVLLEALRRVLAGTVWLPESILAVRGPDDGGGSGPGEAASDRFAPGRTGAATAPATAPTLTPRQLDVMRCLNRGLPTKSISRELDLSENTVKEHIASIFRVLGVHNRTQAVIQAGRFRLGGAA